MSTALRDYQIRGVNDVEASPSQSTLLVIPTGGGKTVCAEELISRALERGETVLVLVHRRELLRQTAERLARRIGELQVGIIAPNVCPSPWSPVQVAMVQTIAVRDSRPPADLIIWDEAHHAMAEQWRSILSSYPAARLVGLTATPQRLDGKPLGDLFESLVVAATYPELLAAGHLVDCRVYQPPEIPGSGLARDPLDAWQRYGEQSSTFGFAGSVQQATDLAARFIAAGIPSAVIEANTPARERDRALQAFAAGTIRVLWNVYCLTEGTDVPSARCVLLARSCAHVSMYLQIVGRVLRPHESKRDALLVDLSGASLIHGMPLEDRAYSLSGRGITRTSIESLKVCQQCGATILSAYQVCPECSFEFPRAKREGPRIYDMELVAVFAGAATPLDAQRREFERLLALAESRDWSLWFVCKEFQKLFSRMPSAELRALPRDRQRELFERMKRSATAKGKSISQVRGTWKHVAGAWPDWSWR